MLRWWKAKKQKEDSDPKMVDIASLGIKSNPSSLMGTLTIPTNHTPVYSNVVNTSIGGGMVGTIMGQSHGVVGSGVYNSGAGNFSFQVHQPPNILSIVNLLGQEVVRITKDGEIVWPNGYQVEEAAEAFARSLHLSTEISAGIKYGMKQKVRDTVFEEMIEMAKEKGSLTADELTYLWQAAKIMDKLKGIG